MAHAVQTMAYVGQTPWHQLGNALPAQQPIEVWAQKAGMDWEIKDTPVRYMTEQAGTLGSIMTFDDQKVLYCRRRLNIEPPCRLKFEPGRVADLGMGNCG